MTSYFPASADVHSNDPHWKDWEEDEMIEEYDADNPPPAEVLSVKDRDDDIWSREGDRWYVSFQAAPASAGYDGSTPADLRVLREWWEIQPYRPFTAVTRQQSRTVIHGDVGQSILITGDFSGELPAFDVNAFFKEKKED